MVRCDAERHAGRSLRRAISLCAGGKLRIRQLVARGIYQCAVHLLRGFFSALSFRRKCPKSVAHCGIMIYVFIVPGEGHQPLCVRMYPRVLARCTGRTIRPRRAALMCPETGGEAEDAHQNSPPVSPHIVPDWDKSMIAAEARGSARSIVCAMLYYVRAHAVWVRDVWMSG